MTPARGRRQAQRPARDIDVYLGARNRGIAIRFLSQKFAEAVDWSFSEPMHNVLVWRGGNAASKEVEFEGGRGGYVTPHMSTVWIIPAGQRSSALVRETSFEFAQLTIPPSVLGTASLFPAADRRDPLLHHLIERIAGTAGRTDVPARLLRDSLADALRLHVVDRYGEQRPTPRENGHGLDAAAQQRLIEFLHDGLDDQIDLAMLAELVGMKIHAFRHAFTQAFRTTPYQYVLDQRLDRAKSLLTTTTMSMTEISLAAGFSSPSHFATTFKQRIGVTPTRYRNGT